MSEQQKPSYNFKFKSRLSSSVSRKKMSNKKIHPAASKEKNNAMSQVLFESQGSKDQVVILETQMQGLKDQALGNETQGSKDQALD